MQSSFEKDLRERLWPFLIPIVRTVAGAVTGVILSMTGIAIAWSLFVFFGGRSVDTWLSSLFFGAGLGAGIAAFVAWLHLDRENTWLLGLTALVVICAGIGGAWGGYQYGSAQEIECCAMPTVSPVYYTALGSAVVSNIAGLAFASARAFFKRKTPNKFHNSPR